MDDKFNEELYSKYVVDGIDVYIDYRLNINKEVEIGVEKFFFMRQLSQIGINVYLSQNPLDSVVLGGGAAFDNKKLLQTLQVREN